MAYANRPITGREYKLILNIDEFKDRDAGIENFLDSIESQIKLLNNEQGIEVRFEKEIKEKKSVVPRYQKL
jgi:hypothetical protein